MSSHIRRFILLTLSHAECGDRVHYTPHFVVSKCRSLFNCESVIVAKELHKAKGYHYHIGILNDTASYHTSTQILRDAFPEFDGRQLNVSFHRSWITICEYVFKQDEDPFCWGTTKERIRTLFSARKGSKKSKNLMTRLSGCETWNDVLKDSILGPRVLKSYSSVKQAFYDLKGNEKLPSLESRLQDYLCLKESSLSVNYEAYTPSELRSKKGAVSWLSRNLSTDRVIREPQLFILGKPKSGKSTFLEGLKEFLSVYDLPARKDDFSGASTGVDLWLMDEFEIDSISPRILNRVLDGQRVSLDCKYGTMFLKEKNVPVILASHIFPSYKSGLRQSAFDSRVEYCEFLPDEHLDVGRLAKTLLELLLARSSPRLVASSFFLED